MGMLNMLKKLFTGTATVALTAGVLTGAAQAQISGNVVKIGVLTDKSGLYADVAGEGAVVAAQMAVEEFGGKAAGKPVQVISADHQNKADISSNIAPMVRYRRCRRDRRPRDFVHGAGRPGSRAGQR